MNDDIFQSIPQGGDRTKDSENSRITAIANKLEGLCAVYEAQLRDGSQHVNRLETEQENVHRYRIGLDRRTHSNCTYGYPCKRFSIRRSLTENDILK